MSERTQPADPDEDEDGFANQLALGFALSMPLSGLIGLILFDEFGLGIALGVVLGPVVAMMLKRFGVTEA